MANKASELQMRVVSASVLAILAVLSVWAGGLAFSFLVCVIAFVVFLEWTAIIGLNAFEGARLRAGINMLLLLALLVLLGPKAALAGLVLFAAYAYVSATVATKELAAWTAFAVVYCGLAAVSLVGLRNGNQGFDAIILLFAIVWASDIGAYFVGRKIGGPKLAPKISPGKTRSGAIGGIIVSMIAAGIVAAVTQNLIWS
ncbi:MAG: phosphatidate cytidylyltransferase, partial [Notoacmeibacter sp.]